MTTIKEVKTKKEQKQFLNFPLRMYRDCPYFVPPLYGDEKKIFSPDYMYYETCEAVYFNAYNEKGEMTGRISGILQKAANEKYGDRRVRFTRFDCIDDEETARALFNAVEQWAMSKGMDTVCGPLGFSDLEREGLLIEGFDQLSTFEEQYNYEYYPRLVEACGYGKEIDWTERMIFKPEVPDTKMREMSQFLLNRYGLHFGTAKNTREFLAKYADQMIELLDTAYEGLYGTVPITEKVKKTTLDNFKLILNIKYVSVILDKDERVVCFSIAVPSIAKAVQKSGGRLTPACLIRLLGALRRPEVIDLALVGVHPDYMDKGVSSALFARLLEALESGQIKYAETNLNLENNYRIQNQWKRFNSVLHKRRRSYVKRLGE